MSDLISKLKTMEPGPDTIRVEGWVRTKRDSKTVTFIEVNDGSCLKGLQVVADISLIQSQPEALSSARALLWPQWAETRRSSFRRQASLL